MTKNSSSQRSNEALQASELSLSDLDKVAGGCPPQTGPSGFGVLPNYNSNNTEGSSKGTTPKSRASRYYHPQW